MSPVLACLVNVIRLTWLGLAALLIAGSAWASPGTPAPGASPPPTLCKGGKDLVFVAHLDDDLLFMNPDIGDSIRNAECVQVVYLTASERGEGDGYMLGREKGVRAAYAYIAGVPDIWTQDAISVGAYHLARFTLKGNPRVQLVHMRIKDPWLGKGWGSLTPLSRAESVPGTTADTLGDYHETYSRKDLVATLASIIQGYHPTTIRHLDDTISVPYTKLCWRCAGHGHPDHIASARLVRDAIHAVPGNYAELGYIEYPSQEREANLDTSEITEKTEAFRRYAWNDYRYCSGEQGCKEPAGPAASWVGRSYYVSRDDMAPDLFADTKGGILILATGEGNDAANIWTSRTGVWGSLGGRTADPLASFTYPDSTIGFFARDALGGMWVNKQNLDDSWAGWQAITGARFAHVPIVGTQDITAAVALGNDGLLYLSRATGTGNTWPAWQPLPDLANATDHIAIATSTDHRLSVFATDSAGRVFETQQAEAENIDHWTAWRIIDAPKTNGGLAAIRNPAGAIELYFRDRDSNHLLRIVQVSTAHSQHGATTWHKATDLGIEYVGKPAVGLNEHGQIAVAVLEQPGGALWLVENAKAHKLTTNVASSPALRVLQDKLYIVARNAGRLQTYQVQERSKGVWASALTVNIPPAGGGGAFVRRAAIAAPTMPAPVVPGQTILMVNGATAAKH